MLVLVDLVIRSDPEPDRGGATHGWEPAQEATLHAVTIATLRLTAEAHDRDAVLAERALLAAPVERAVAFAPVATHWAVRVTSLDVRPTSRRCRSSTSSAPPDDGTGVPLRGTGVTLS
jgi:hypothetical protein